MHARQQRPVQAVALAAVLALVVIVFLTYGTGGVLALAVVGLLVGSYLARRYVYQHLGERYARHGDHMD